MCLNGEAHLSKSTILVIVCKAHHHMVSVHLISLPAFLYCFTPLQTHRCALCSYKVPAPLGLRPSYWHSLSLWITLAQMLAHPPPSHHSSPRYLLNREHTPEIAVTTTHRHHSGSVSHPVLFSSVHLSQSRADTHYSFVCTLFVLLLE